MSVSAEPVDSKTHEQKMAQNVAQNGSNGRRSSVRGIRIPKSSSMEKVDENSVLSDLVTSDMAQTMKQELYAITGSPHVNDGALAAASAMGDEHGVGIMLNGSSSEDSELDAAVENGDEGSPISDTEQQMLAKMRMLRR